MFNRFSTKHRSESPCDLCTFMRCSSANTSCVRRHHSVRQRMWLVKMQLHFHLPVRTVHTERFKFILPSLFVQFHKIRHARVETISNRNGKTTIHVKSVASQSWSISFIVSLSNRGNFCVRISSNRNGRKSHRQNAHYMLHRRLGKWLFNRIDLLIGNHPQLFCWTFGAAIFNMFLMKMFN